MPVAVNLGCDYQAPHLAPDKPAPIRLGLRWSPSCQDSRVGSYGLLDPCRRPRQAVTAVPRQGVASERNGRGPKTTRTPIWALTGVLRRTRRLGTARGRLAVPTHGAPGRFQQLGPIMMNRSTARQASAPSDGWGRLRPGPEVLMAACACTIGRSSPGWLPLPESAPRYRRRRGDCFADSLDSRLEVSGRRATDHWRPGGDAE